MKKDHSLTYIDLHPQDLESRNSRNSSNQSTLGDKILWVIIWILTLCTFGALSYISVQLNLFA